MPGREIKQTYPSCNRAFTLRMMNPTSYAEDKTSPLDKEIKPVYKKIIAKNISDESDNVRRSSYTSGTISADEVSLSPASSMTSMSEMELYDIDENQHDNHYRDLGMIRQHSSLDDYTKSKKSQKNSQNSNGFIARSHSSADGFDGFSRNSPARSTMPSRLRSKTMPNNNKQVNGTTAPQGKNKGNKDTLQSNKNNWSPNGKSSNNTESPSLKRTQSLRGRVQVGIPGDILTNGVNGHRNSPNNEKSPNTQTKLRVTGTKSSQLRAKLHDAYQPPSPSPTRKSVTGKSSGRSPVVFTRSVSVESVSKQRYHSADEFSESDSSSTVFSEIDAYNPRNNPRGNKLSLHNGMSKHQKHVKRQSPNEQHQQVPNHAHAQLDMSLQYSTPSVPSSKPNLASSPVLLQLQSKDTFSSKLSDVCHLISERHPGDFQILETLVEMQAAYEERNELVKNTITGLRDKIRGLEHKVANSPNIPGLVIPLMRATNMFQNQLQSIMDSQDKTSCDASMQFPDDKRQEITLDEISVEANNVAQQLERLGRSPRTNGHTHSRVETNDLTYLSNRQSKNLESKIESLSSSDKENLCNYEHGDALDTYAIITEPVITV